MATYVLVHGGWCYQPVSRLLRAQGHDVYAPSLTGLGEREHLFRCDVDLDCHITDIVKLLHFEDLRALMALARSDSRTVDGVEMRMYIDNKTIPYYGVHDPEQVERMTARLTPHPWRCFEQPLRLTDEATLAKIPQSYICTTMFMNVRPVDTLRQKADGRLWELDTGHDMMITAPEWVAEKLMLLASLAG